MDCFVLISVKGTEDSSHGNIVTGTVGCVPSFHPGVIIQLLILVLIDFSHLSYSQFPYVYGIPVALFSIYMHIYIYHCECLV